MTKLDRRYTQTARRAHSLQNADIKQFRPFHLAAGWPPFFVPFSRERLHPVPAARPLSRGSSAAPQRQRVRRRRSTRHGWVSRTPPLLSRLLPGCWRAPPPVRRRPREELGLGLPPSHVCVFRSSSFSRFPSANTYTSRRRRRLCFFLTVLRQETPSFTALLTLCSKADDLPPFLIDHFFPAISLHFLLTTSLPQSGRSLGAEARPGPGRRPPCLLPRTLAFPWRRPSARTPVESSATSGQRSACPRCVHTSTYYLGPLAYRWVHESNDGDDMGAPPGPEHQWVHPTTVSGL